MIFFLLIGMTVIVLLLEFAVAPRAPRHLLLRYTFDTQLAEPGETVTFSGRLINNWLCPVTYFNLFESMPEGAEVAAKENWIEFLWAPLDALDEANLLPEAFRALGSGIRSFEP